MNRLHGSGLGVVAGCSRRIAKSDSVRATIIDGCLGRVLAAAGCALIVFTAPVGAQRSSEVVVTTRIVMASNNGASKLSGADMVTLQRSLRLFPYSSFRLLQQERRPVRMERMVEFPVPGGRHLLVQPTSFKNGRVSLYVMLMQGQETLVNTVLKLRNRGEFVVAGPHHEDGVLFLSIGAMVKERVNGLRPARGQ